MLVSALYLVLRHTFWNAVLGCRSYEFKELEIVVLYVRAAIAPRFTSPAEPQTHYFGTRRSSISVNVKNKTTASASISQNT